MIARRFRACIAFVTLLFGLSGCGDPSEAPRVRLPVVVDAAGMAPVVTDLGYEVEVTSARIALSDLLFTVAGEVHTASVWQTISEAFVGSAHAHPGHYQGGEVTGEMLGDYVVEWSSEEGRQLGVATLIALRYSAANFTFGRGSAEQLSAGDPLLGHTAILAGTATKGASTISFTIVVDSPEGRELVGAPFEADLGADATGTLAFRFNVLDPLEGDTLFDGVDFAGLDTDADEQVVIEPDDAEFDEAYNVLRRQFQTHDHFSIHYLE